MYQGHLPDGSSVQRHSAGSLYPYVLYGQQVDDRVLWGVLTPHGTDTGARFSYGTAAFCAGKMKERQALKQAARLAYNRPGIPPAAVNALVHLVGDPVEEGLFVRTPQQELDDRWSNARDADFNIGPGARWTEVR